MNPVIESYSLCRDKICIKEKCRQAKLKLRKTLPRTAYVPDAKYFDYYQCPKCKVNYAFVKH